ncbi:MAG: tetratricopeptide repeat protein [Clostridia bacterium]|nr:tetratricopeptide repeat protein [Clostridia bacterium]
MASIKVEIKNKADIDRKPRVYFTCHPDDFDKYFRKICDDIFRSHDCAIYYTEDMTELFAEEDKETDLGRNNLFVIPVTFKLLSTPNRAMDEDFPYAIKEHIPVLPIMLEPGIDVLYSRPDKFGELQYLNPYSTDLTEISYEEKLKKYLESVLISDELAQRVRAAFDAYIFLSYRKKDRRYANELMRIIHSNPECLDIAIWFDEFLTPGENFKENIEKMLDDCKLFTLLVTPHLSEKVIDENGKERDNYIISTELPLAQKKKKEKGTEIFAVEMEDTDRNFLATININDYVNSKDEENFRSRLLESISKIAVSGNDNDPEHNFLIGLAYLDGIDVEVDRERGLALITSAAEAGLPEAMRKLHNMYYEGIGVKINYRKAVKWCEHLADYYKQQYGKEHPDTLTYLNNLAVIYGKLGDYRKAFVLTEKVYALRCKKLGKNHPDTLTSQSNMASIYGELGDLQKELRLNEKVYTLRCKFPGEEHPDTLTTLNNLASTYGDLGDYQKALELNQKAYTVSCKILGEEHPNTLTSLNNLAFTYRDLGYYQKALEQARKAYALRCTSLGQEHPDTLTSLGNLALIYSNLGDKKKALKVNETSYALHCKVLGEEHPDTLLSLNNLAIFYSKLGNQKKALELNKKAYSLRCKVLGEENPVTLVSQGNLALTYKMLGNYQKAVELTEKSYALSCELLGEEHPSTLISLSNLAVIYGNLGDHQKALELNEKSYVLHCKVLGEEHPNTHTSMKNLACSYGKIGKYHKENELRERLYTLQIEHLMKEYPNRSNVLNMISIVISKLMNIKKLWNRIKSFIHRTARYSEKNNKK